MLPEKAALQRLLQGLELGDVDRGDREQHHEQRHQKRDHVGVGQQPALGALLLLWPPPTAPARAPLRHAQAACDSSIGARRQRSSSLGALGRRHVGHQLFGDQPRVVAGLDREDALDGHHPQLDLFAGDRLEAVGDGQEDHVGGADAHQRGDEGGGDRGAERGRARRGSASTCTSPSTVPMIPIVGANPPAFSNGAAPASWRAAMPSTSASRIAWTISGSVPSTTSCRALRVKVSSISPSWASSASRPSRRALSASVDEPVELAAHVRRFG